MHFSEDNLRSALRRKNPGTRFTEQVMARVGQEPAQKESSGGRPSPRLRKATAIALAAGVLFAAGTFEHRQQVRRHQEAEFAREQALLALRITTAELNKAVRQAQDKIKSKATIISGENKGREL
ncbi:MAG: hypothetical protein NVS9B4_13670 [Candidatus Acidiferrum sp.]